MEPILKIKCPWCGSVLSVKSQPGMESKSVTCPICKQKSHFKDFKPVADRSAEEKTQYPGSEDPTSYNTGSASASAGQSPNLILGQLSCPDLGQPYRLKPGRNIVGRKASNSTADCQIPPLAGSKRMSREHLVIEVKKVAGKGFVHYVSLYKERVNVTFVNNAELEYGDCIVLSHGDIIRLPDAVVKFEIPDEEGTQL